MFPFPFHREKRKWGKGVMKEKKTAQHPKTSPLLALQYVLLIILFAIHTLQVICGSLFANFMFKSPEQIDAIVSLNE